MVRLQLAVTILTGMFCIRKHVKGLASRSLVSRQSNRLGNIQFSSQQLPTSVLFRPSDSGATLSQTVASFTPTRLFSTEPSKEWTQLGLVNELVEAVASFDAPTEVQKLVIPQLIQPQANLAFLSATGSGKTLAYCLPLLQVLKSQELFEGYERRPKRPRLLVLAPTRELVLQIHSVVKSLCHHIKLSSVALLGGEDTGKQRKRLSGNVDVLVTTPGRLVKHWTAQNVFLGEITHIVVDEMDTMLEQGFEKELQRILYPILYRKQPNQPINSEDYTDSSPRLIMTSATLTQHIQKMVGDTSQLVNAKKHYQSATTGLTLPQLRVLQAPGLHKAVPRLQQTFINVGTEDKLSLLVDRILQSEYDDDGLTMIFCNTAASCRAVQFALQEAGVPSLACHGELNSAMRVDQLRRFRQVGVETTSQEPPILVCTDLVARGLDVPQVHHVVMFDFPLNSLDYLHRSGRTARGTQSGRVTALVTKRDQVLATAIQMAVQKGEPLDGLSSRKTDYLPGGRLHSNSSGGNNSAKSGSSTSKGDRIKSGSRKPARFKSSSSGGASRMSLPNTRQSKSRSTSTKSRVTKARSR